MNCYVMRKHRINTECMILLTKSGIRTYIIAVDGGVQMHFNVKEHDGGD